jgi:alpha-tubulin suppressor-like RCC1 family protein
MGITAEHLSVGGGSTFVIQADGSALSWGYNNFDNLGIGSAGNRDMPTELMTTARFRRIWASGAGNTCGIDLTFMPLCWGRNDVGETGDGTRTQHDAPVPVVDVSEAFAVHPGYHAAYVIAPEGYVLSLSDSAPEFVVF